MEQKFEKYLASTRFFDWEHPSVKAYAEEIVAGISDPRQIAVKLYYAVRDDIHYNPYSVCPDPNSFKASYVIKARESYCIPKAVLLSTLARYLKIPARIAFADVRNHIASPKLIEFLKTDLFVMHGYSELFIEDKWVAATPAFNKSLCDRMGVEALDFDGRSDSLFQQSTPDQKQYMEYVCKHGSFEDLPMSMIVEAFTKTYPHLVPAMLSNRTLEDDLKS